MSTSWTVLYQAHEGNPEQKQAAREALLGRYQPVVRRYLLGVVRDPDVADELAQEFAVRFLRGAFQRASPDRGRFPRFLKTCLRNLAVDHQRKLGQRRMVSLPEHEIEAADRSEPTAEAGQEFIAMWREELVAHALAGFQTLDAQGEQHLYAVLRLRMDNPGMRSGDMAARFSELLGRSITDIWIRKKLHAARTKLAELLLLEVVASMENPTVDSLEQELIEIGLYEYCKPALAKGNRLLAEP